VLALVGFLWLRGSSGPSVPQQALSHREGKVTVSGGAREEVVDAVRAANDKAVSALDAIDASNVSGDALVQAMNLAIINFPTGSAEIPEDSMEILRRSAALFSRAPAGSHIEIGGHTDNTGDPAENLALSQARADAVKSALVGAGVPAEMLSTKGYGDTEPRTANDTEFGRFQNRRIEYRVVQ
jgi:OOP family OmpA-OmpF porin